jgi:hypothetical protein
MGVGYRHALAALSPRQEPGTGGWVGPREGLDGCGKSRLHRTVQTRSESLYRLRYPGPVMRLGAERFGVRNSEGVRCLLLVQKFQAGFWAHKTFRGSFPDRKAFGV